MSYRWYFPVHQWNPTKVQLKLISSLIQSEEKIRLARFHFMKDAKSSLIGRLLIRKLINIKTSTPNHLIKLGRDESNKPILLEPKIGASENLNFNVSHQGNYVVLASDPVAEQLGIDIMNIERPGSSSQSVDEYFRLMRSTFSDNEWTQIKGQSINSPIANFTRFWALKESYVKAIGLGIVIDLRSISFNTKTDLPPIGQFVTDTQITVNGNLNTKWNFEERFLDSQHIVAVAKLGESPVPKFELVNLEFLLNQMSPLCEEDDQWADGILTKKLRAGE